MDLLRPPDLRFSIGSTTRIDGIVGKTDTVERFPETAEPIEGERPSPGGEKIHTKLAYSMPECNPVPHVNSFLLCINDFGPTWLQN